MNRILVVTSILLKNDSYVLVEQNRKNIFNNLWQFPGGQVEENETLLQALRRELIEELDLIIDENKLIPFTFTEYKKENNIFDIFFYVYKDLSWFHNREHQQLQLIPIKDLKKMNFIPFNEPAIDMLLKFKIFL